MITSPGAGFVLDHVDAVFFPRVLPDTARGQHAKKLRRRIAGP
jgi:hypothetical protein